MPRSGKPIHSLTAGQEAALGIAAVLLPGALRASRPEADGRLGCPLFHCRPTSPQPYGSSLRENWGPQPNSSSETRAKHGLLTDHAPSSRRTSSSSVSVTSCHQTGNQPWPNLPGDSVGHTHSTWPRFWCMCVCAHVSQLPFEQLLPRLKAISPIFTPGSLFWRGYPVLVVLRGPPTRKPHKFCLGGGGATGFCPWASKDPSTSGWAKTRKPRGRVHFARREVADGDVQAPQAVVGVPLVGAEDLSESAWGTKGLGHTVKKDAKSMSHHLGGKKQKQQLARHTKRNKFGTNSDLQRKDQAPKPMAHVRHHLLWTGEIHFTPLFRNPGS